MSISFENSKGTAEIYNIIPKNPIHLSIIKVDITSGSFFLSFDIYAPLITSIPTVDGKKLLKKKAIIYILKAFASETLKLYIFKTKYHLKATKNEIKKNDARAKTK